MRTVFFGPFVGEFGWEMARWQWWVRKVCLEEFKDFRKIACSFPGRAAFYPNVDEFWPLPQSFLNLKLIPWGYITAGWREGWPGHYTEKQTCVPVPDSWSDGPKPVRFMARAVRRIFPPVRVNETRLGTPDVEPRAVALLDEFKRRLPQDTVFFMPWKMNKYGKAGLVFGVEIDDKPKGLSSFKTQPIPYSAQQVECLRPTSKGEDLFRRMCPENRRLVAVFPRHIAVRRSDRNWAKSKYQKLISLLQIKFPELQVALFGEPGGAYFAGDAPKGCLNLIDAPQDMRLDLQLAALKNSVFALGGASGGLSMAMAAGCPVLWWGYEYASDMVHRCNPLGTPMLFYPSMHPSVEEVMRLAQSVYWMTQHGSWKDRYLERQD